MGFVVMQLGLPVDLGILAQTQAAWFWHLLYSSYHRLLYNSAPLEFIEQVNINIV